MTDYAHRSDDQYARKLERARQLQDSWTRADEEAHWQAVFASHPTTDTYPRREAA